MKTGYRSYHCVGIYGFASTKCVVLSHTHELESSYVLYYTLYALYKRSRRICTHVHMLHFYKLSGAILHTAITGKNKNTPNRKQIEINAGYDECARPIFSRMQNCSSEMNATLRSTLKTSRVFSKNIQWIHFGKWILHWIRRWNDTVATSMENLCMFHSVRPKL